MAEQGLTCTGYGGAPWRIGSSSSAAGRLLPYPPPYFSFLLSPLVSLFLARARSFISSLLREKVSERCSRLFSFFFFCSGGRYGHVAVGAATCRRRRKLDIAAPFVLVFCFVSLPLPRILLTIHGMFWSRLFLTIIFCC